MKKGEEKMKKRILSLLTMLCIVVALLPVNVTAFTSIVDSGICGDNLTWTLDDAGTLTISGTGNMYDYEVSASEMWDIYSTTPWKNHMFKIKSVIFEKGITKIGDQAFQYCKNLSSVQFSNTITNLGFGSFCSTDIEYIFIPKSVVDPYYASFMGCLKLTEIMVSEDNPVYTSYDGILFSKDMTTIYQYPNGKTVEEYIVPDYVTDIKESAFSQSRNLKRFVLHEDCDFIDIWFDWCTSLESIYIPRKVETIGNYAFMHCENLKNIYFSGTPEEWENIEIGGIENDALNKAQIHFIFTKTTVSVDGTKFTVTPINIVIGNTVILALYNGDTFVEMQSATYNGEDIPFTTSESYTKVKVFVWSNLTDIMPICDVEIIE